MGEEEIIRDLKWLLKMVKEGKYGHGDDFDVEAFGEDHESVSSNWF